MKTKILSVLICAILSCLTIASYTQTVTTEPGKSLFTENKFHFIPHPWFTRGNSGTDTSINFIGTRDAQPLLFKVNNQKAGYLDYSDISENTAFGYQTLNSNVVSGISGISGSYNSAFGFFALSSNITGEVNTAHGAGALYSNTEGNVNTSIGGFSLQSNTTGAFNTATGAFALSANTTGGFNTANGAYALANNATGSFNIATGTPFTLSSNTEGSDNIATGALALTSNTIGNANVAYGSFSLGSNTTGNNNTALGFGTDVTESDLTNATAIGSGTLVDASNKVRIGNTDVTSIGGEVGWTIYSDARIKDNIQENVPGLEFIKALRPVTYHLNIAKENSLLGVRNIDTKSFTLPELKDLKNGKVFKMPVIKNMTDYRTKSITAIKHDIEKIQFTGFVAQDVDRVAKNIGYDFSGIDKSGKIMGLRYSDFVVPLVKAVQELSKQNDDLQKRIEKLETLLASQSNGNLQDSKSISIASASLAQNIPNPFNKSTSISYTLPQKFSVAEIIITDQNGNILKRTNITGAGKGIMNFDTTMMSAGAYSYSLIIDGHITETKKMVLVK